MPGKSNRTFTIGKKLFLSVIALFVVFVASFVIYQYQREKAYKIELINNRLQGINDNINLELYLNPDTDLDQYTKLLTARDLRVTIIDFNGEVIFDNYEKDLEKLDNHLEREEIREAIDSGKGTDVRRTSETTGIQFFYSATRYDDYIIRTAIPYSHSLTESLRIDYHYIWFSLVIAIILIIIFYNVIEKMGVSINQLREFAIRIDQNEPYDNIMESISSNDELGEISQHIIRIYQRLHDTKEALYIEREKLITHLQTSREGLGVFTKDRREVLVNNLFTKFCNIISDQNLEKTEDVFNVPEFQPVVDFIDKVQRRPIGKNEKRFSTNINKNGRTFILRCIIFQDSSFEISINDITQKEEQTLLKRQLTQNIAHELKTPVSSIQAYLETIVNNPDISPEKTKVFLNRCYEQSNRLAELLRDISVLTRMDEAAGMIEMAKVNISTMVENLITEVSLKLEAKHIIVHNNLKKNIIVRGNHSLLYSIFSNLINNSISYAGDNVQIIINCFREDENYYYFSFADTGIGVADVHMQRLFERFYRIDKGRSRKAGGTGLGLAIVKNAVLIHGGSISAKKNQGGGLEFIFTLAKDR